MSDNAEEMKVSLSMENINCSFGEPCESYQDAVHCLTNCEAIIKILEEQLASKDEHIATLEGKLVKMSMELASSKAFEDEHRSKRRSSDGDASSPSCQANKRMVTRVKFMEQLGVESMKTHEKPEIEVDRSHRSLSLFGLGSSLAAELDCGASRESFTSRASSHVWSLEEDSSSNSFSNLGGIFFRRSCSEVGSTGSLVHGNFPNDDDPNSGGDGQGGGIDESSSSRLSNLGQFFRARRSQRDPQDIVVQETPMVDNGKKDEGGTRRRPRNPKRAELAASSRSFLSAVLFPVSSDDCIKGCIDRKSINKGLRGGTNEQWPDF